MKKVLITGKDSYIGTNVERYLVERSYQVDTIDMRGNAWREYDFSPYDAVFHVAGIAHADVEKVSEEEKKRYYDVNCHLAVETAKKAKEQGVGLFVFMSSIIVYGESGGIGKKRVIKADTPLTPANFYGDSKVKAEEGLRPLAHKGFQIAILRPPMIYGEGCKGNYRTLEKFARIMPVFPAIENERSVLSIENLAKTVEKIIENPESGVYFPQDARYGHTVQMVQDIAAGKGKKVRLTKVFNPAIRCIGKTKGKYGRLVNKAFGNLCYDKELKVEKWNP